jgi:hypothetical protein
LKLTVRAKENPVLFPLSRQPRVTEKSLFRHMTGISRGYPAHHHGARTLLKETVWRAWNNSGSVIRIARFIGVWPLVYFHRRHVWFFQNSRETTLLQTVANKIAAIHVKVFDDERVIAARQGIRAW